MTIKAIAAIVGQIVWKFLTVWLIRADAKKDAQREGYATTRKAIDDADAAMGDDPVVLRDWLRERGQR